VIRCGWTPRSSALLASALIACSGIIACSGSKDETPTGSAESATGGTVDVIDTGGGGVSPPGWLEVDGTRCTVDDGDLLGFCGESSSTFWADGSTQLADADCARALSATVWMSAASWDAGGDHALVGESTELQSGEATVWFDLDDDTWVGETGTATAERVGVERVRVVFEAPATVDFLTGEEAGPAVQGEVWCTLSDP
jgi:hypothetical protein